MVQCHLQQSSVTVAVELTASDKKEGAAPEPRLPQHATLSVSRQNLAVRLAEKLMPRS